MLKLNVTSGVIENILNCDYISFSPSEISTINTAISQIYNDIPRKDYVTSLLNSYLDLKFDLSHAASTD